MARRTNWRLTVGISAALAAAWAAIFLVGAWNAETLQVNIRLTARAAVVLFMLAFGASSLHALRPSRFTKWLLRNRRYVGVSFAVAHFIHLGMLVARDVVFPVPDSSLLNPLSLVFGGFAYLVIAALALTSNDRAVAWLGAQRWKRLHLVGGYYIWFIFTRTYALRAVEDPFFAPFALALFGVLAMRLVVLRRKKRRAPPRKAPLQRA